MDTTGSIAALIGLVIGITALFIDKYDLSFTPRGFLKDAVDAADDFVKFVDPVARTLSGIIKGIEDVWLKGKEYLCDEVYTALGAGATIPLFSSFFPGASTVAGVTTRSAYYGVRTANAFTNLANRAEIQWHYIFSCSS